MTRSRHRTDRIAAVAIAALLLTPAAAAAGDGLRGRAPSGAAYHFTWERDRAGRLCERLRFRAGDERSGSRNCQPVRGRSARGLWTLDCRSLDFALYGTTYRRSARVALHREDGGVVHARRRAEGRRAVFLLVAAGGGLPARVEVTGRDGRVLRTIRFESADALCGGAGDPLEVGYVF